MGQGSREAGRYGKRYGRKGRGKKEVWKEGKEK